MLATRSGETEQPRREAAADGALSVHVKGRLDRRDRVAPGEFPCESFALKLADDCEKRPFQREVAFPQPERYRIAAERFRN